MSMNKKSIIILLSATALVLTACQNKKSENTIRELAESSSEKAQTVMVERGDMQVSTSYDALVGPKVVQLTFPDEGVFGEYTVGLGDTVKEGDILAVTDMEQLEDEIEEKERELSNLTADYEFQKAALDIRIRNYDLDIADTTVPINKIIYQEDKKRIELQMKQLQETFELEAAYCQTQLQKLKEQSSSNVIKAPFDGIVVGLYHVETSGTEIADIDPNLYYVAIADPDILYARCDYISQSLINTMERISFWKDGVEYNASYIPMTEKKYREMNNNGENLYSEFLLENPDGVIESGDYGRIKLIALELKQVLFLPDTAVLRDADGPYVYRDKDGIRERVSIETGSKDGIRVEIISGLEEGDVVYVQG